jgi:hypothetical protein
MTRYAGFAFNTQPQCPVPPGVSSRRFVNEVSQPLRQLDDGDWMVEITMVETGERTEYSLNT